MPRPSQRTTKRRKIHKKTPKGKTKKVVKRRITTKAKCGLCKKTLQGVKTTKKLSKTKKKPGRKYSGNLCSTCTQRIVKLQARINEGKIYKKDANVRYQKYLTGKKK